MHVQHNQSYDVIFFNSTVTVNSDVMSTPMGADIEAEMQHVVVETLNALVHTPQENFNNAKRDASQCQHVL